MGFVPTSLDEKVESARQRFEANLPDTDAWLYPNNVYVSSIVMGGIWYEVDKSLQTIYKDMFPDTSRGSVLDRWAGMFGLSRRPAVSASGDVLVTGTPGAVIPVTAAFTRSDGVTFTPTASATIPASGEIAVNVQADLADYVSNSIPGTPLVISAAPVGVNSNAVVGAEGVFGGALEERDEELQRRVVQRTKNPPMLGNPSDYWRWTMSQTGVTRVHGQRRGHGASTYGVWFMMDESYENGIPLAADVASVSAYIDAVAPGTAIPVVRAPNPVSVDVEVSGTGLTDANGQALIAAEIRRAMRVNGKIAGVGEAYYFNTQIIWGGVQRATKQAGHSVLMPTSTSLLIPDESVPVLGKLTVSS